MPIDLKTRPAHQKRMALAFEITQLAWVGVKWVSITKLQAVLHAHTKFSIARIKCQAFFAISHAERQFI